MNEDQTDNEASAGSDPDILRTDPEQRRKVQQLIAAMAVAALLLLWLGLPALKRWVDVKDIDVVIQRMALVSYGLSAMLLATAAYAAWYARRIFRSSQFPPPGSWVMKDTRPLRGDHARARGWWVMTCAIIFALIAVFSAVLLPARFDGLLRASTMPLQNVPPIAASHG